MLNDQTRRTCAWLFLIMLSVGTGGCTEAVTDDAGTVIRYCGAVRDGFAAATLGLAGMGGLICLTRWRGWAMLGLIGLLIVAPLVGAGVYRSRITLTDEAVFERLPFARTDREVLRFDRTRRVAYTTVRERRGRSMQDTELAMITGVDGQTVTRRLSTLWDAARPTIDPWMARCGVVLGPDVAALGRGGAR